MFEEAAAPGRLWVVKAVVYRRTLRLGKGAVKIGLKKRLKRIPRRRILQEINSNKIRVNARVTVSP